VNLLEINGLPVLDVKISAVVDIMNLFPQHLTLLIFAVVLSLLSFNYTNTVISTSQSLYDSVIDSEDVGLIKSIPSDNTILSSLTIDPILDLVYISGMPDSCLKDNMNPNNVSSFELPCSTIYIVNGSTGQINNSIRLRPGEIIHDMTINPHSGKIYAAGEYNYRDNNTEPVQYEDDVVFIINQTDYSNNTTNDNSSQNINSYNIKRIRLYGEEEEGKEGDMSSIAVDTHTNKIYAGIRYFQGGREGYFLSMIIMELMLQRV
jgi:hypothetical protein